MKMQVASINLRLGAGDKSVAAKLGPSLGQFGLNLREVGLLFQEKSSIYKSGQELRVRVKVFSDRSFEMVIMPPTLSGMLKGICRLNGKSVITLTQIYEVAKYRSLISGLADCHIKSEVKGILGTLKSSNIILVR